MTEKSKKKVTLTSPKGVFLWPHLMKPHPDYGKYAVTLRLPADEAQKFIEKLQPAFDEATKVAEAAYKKLKPAVRKKKAFVMNDFYEEVYDEDDNPTGEILFKFNKKAGGKRKDDTVWKAAPPVIFDAAKKPLKKNVEIWSGTIGKVAFYTDPYYSATIDGGMSLRISGVQIIELVQGGQSSAESLGFEEEDGFSVNDIDDDASDLNETSSDDTEDDDEEDEEDF